MATTELPPCVADIRRAATDLTAIIDRFQSPPNPDTQHVTTTFRWSHRGKYESFMWAGKLLLARVFLGSDSKWYWEGIRDHFTKDKPRYKPGRKEAIEYVEKRYRAVLEDQSRR